MAEANGGGPYAAIFDRIGASALTQGQELAPCGGREKPVHSARGFSISARSGDGKGFESAAIADARTGLDGPGSACRQGWIVALRPCAARGPRSHHLQQVQAHHVERTGTLAVDRID